MSYPAPPSPPPYYAPPPPQPPKKGAGLAVTALVLGIVALVLSWVPIINNLAAVLAVVGLGFGIPALVRARRGTHGGQGMAVAGLVTSAVALVVVIATQAFYSEVIDEVERELDGISESIDRESTRDSAAAEESEAEAREAEEGTAADVVPLGTPAQVGDYEVTVDAVQLDGNAVVAGANQFNEPPTGQYVITQLTVTYTGTDEGHPGFDLTAIFHGSDSRQYSDAECSAVLPDDAMSAPTLNPGGSDSFQFCMDVPPAAMTGAQLSIEPTLSWDAEDRVFYAIG